MRLKYVGAHESIDIPELGLTVGQGEIIEVEDAVGKRMADSTEWQQTAPRPRKDDD